MAAAVLSAVLLLFSSHLPGRAPSPAMSVATAQQKVADLILISVFGAVQIFFQLLPGVSLALVVYTVYAKRDQLTRTKISALVAVLAFSAVVWALQVRMSAAKSTTPAHGQAMVLGPVHSGEAVYTKDGRFIMLPDPTKPEGSPLEPGWQRSLATAMTDAIKMGKEQVVLVFSRQGCPWCERQVPVLQRAIQNRAKVVEEATRGMEADTAFIFGGEPVGQGMLLSPLRVFVLDAGEFPYLAQQFRIEAFPTSMFFGQPGAVPQVAQGYLNDEQMEEVLHHMALAPKQTPGGGNRKRRGLFR